MCCRGLSAARVGAGHTGTHATHLINYITPNAINCPVLRVIIPERKTYEKQRGIARSGYQDAFSWVKGYRKPTKTPCPR